MLGIYHSCYWLVGVNFGDYGEGCEGEKHIWNVNICGISVVQLVIIVNLGVQLWYLFSAGF